MHQELIDNIFKDFKSFFVDQKQAKIIKYRLVDDLSQPMKVCRTKSKSYIAISKDIEYLDISDDVSKVYILFMIGHELAHLVNKHLDYKDQNNFDSKTLEMWADFFGTKIAMAILQDGTRFNQMLSANFKDVNIGLKVIFEALSMLNDNVFKNTNSSNKYLSNDKRTSTVVAAIIAFLIRKQMIFDSQFSEKEHADIGCKWGMAIYGKLYESGILDKLYTANKTNMEDIKELANNVHVIHSKLKKDNRQLIKGLKMVYSYILDTSYGKPKPNQLLIDNFNRQFKARGWRIKL